jgi:hypothetical protein
MQTDPYLKATDAWLQDFVLKLNLCPFAHQPYQQGRVRFALSEAQQFDTLAKELLQELLLLYQADPKEWETTLLVHPHCLNSWEEFLEFWGLAEYLIAEAGLEGEIQVVGFHPDYQFGEEAPEDPSHFTNRSPFPMLHLIREASLSQAVASHPEPDMIPIHNIEKLQKIGREELEKRLKSYF